MNGAEVVKLPHTIVERLRREARRLGISVEEYVLELILQDLDPRERVREYIGVAKDLVEQAVEELREGNVRQAAEKLWSSAALVVKAYAGWREGKRVSSHKELWEYKGKMVREFGEWVHDAWMNANGMHTCFYEGWCSREDVEEALKRIRKLVEEVADKVMPRGD